MSQIHYMNIEDLAEEIRSKNISPVEVTQSLLNRIEKIDINLKSYANITADSALADADLAEKEIMAGKYRGLLHGVPIAVKDLCFTKGVPTMGGTAVMKDFVPSFDATVIERFKDAGAVLLGKLNMTEGAMRGYSPNFDAPYNPWNRSFSPGGSSSGSGAATAAGLCYGSLGSDTGGSIRFPSAMNGIVGIKPTWGRVSRFGIMDLAQSLDHVGPMTRSVTDAEILLEIISGRDENDPTTLQGKYFKNSNDHQDSGMQGVNVGFAENYITEGVDKDITKASLEAIAILESAGANIIDVSIPDLMEYIAGWRDICTAEAVTAHQEFFPSRESEYGAMFRSWLQYGASITASDYADAHHKRLICNGIMADVFNKIDVLVCPTIVSFEPRLSDEELFFTPLKKFSSKHQKFTVPFDFNGAPTVTVPGGLNAQGILLSVQFASKPLREDVAIKAAKIYERSTEHSELHPDI